MRYIIIVLVLSFSVVGCSQNSGLQKEFVKSDATVSMNEETIYSEVVILEIRGSTLMIAPHATDPEAAFPVYQVIADEKTSVVGSKNAVDALQVGDDVKVWALKNDSNAEVAVKVEVIEKD